MSDVHTSNNQKTEEELQGRYMFPISFFSEAQGLINGKLFGYSITGKDFEDFHTQSLTILKKLSKHVETKGWDLREDSHLFTKDLSEVGLSLYNTIFRDPEAHNMLLGADHQAKLYRQAIQLWLMQPLSFKPFWEILYMGSPEETSVQADQFWGTRYSLGRDFIPCPSLQTIVLGKGLLAAIHQDLNESGHEIQSIERLLAESSEKRLVWLESEYPVEKPIAFRDFMEILLTDSFGYGVVHFACHCQDFHEEGASKAQILITIRKEDLVISVNDLTRYFKRPFPHRPFFFLNACETQMLAHPMQSLDFPSNLLQLAAGGVIATACVVPDNFASVFAKEFYQRLFQRYCLKKKGSPPETSLEDSQKDTDPLPLDPSQLPEQYIAKVLMETRRFFLETYNNPLGLAYGLYGRADQEFRFY